MCTRLALVTTLILVTLIPLGDSVSEFQFASYTVTQRALDDAPTRYSRFLQDALDAAAGIPLPDANDGGSGCRVQWEIDGTKAVKTFTIVPGTLQVTILNTTSIRVYGVTSVVLNVPVYLKACKRFIFCFCHSTCDNSKMTSVTTTASITADLTLKLDTKSGVLTVTPVVSISFAAFDIEGCNFGGFLGWLFGVKKRVTTALENLIVQSVNKYATAFSTPPLIEPYNGIFVGYAFTSLVMLPREAVLLTAKGNVSVTVVEGEPLVVFDDPDPEDAAMAPPNDFTLSHGSSLVLMNQLRISSTLLTALVWAAGSTGTFGNAFNTTILDATLAFRIYWANPFLGIPADNQLRLDVAAGFVNGTCATAGSGLNKPILVFNFANLTGAAWINCTQDMSLMLQIESFDVSRVALNLDVPPLPVPEKTLNNVLEDLLQSSIPGFNLWLQQNAFVLPPNIAQYIPNPVVSLHNQSNCCNHLHGYIELSSFCSCADLQLSNTQAEPGILPCQFPCNTTSALSVPTSYSITDTVADTTTHSMSVFDDDNTDDIDDVLSRSVSVSVSAQPSPSPQPDAPLNPSNSTAPRVLLLSAYASASPKTNLTNLECNLHRIGDQLTISRLTDTSGTCVSADDGSYYSLDMPYLATRVASVELFCVNDTCGDSCLFRRPHGVDYYTCQSASAKVSLLFGLNDSLPCVGPAWAPSNLVTPMAVLVTYNASSSCNGTEGMPIAAETVAAVDGGCYRPAPAETYARVAPYQNVSLYGYNATFFCSDNNCAASDCLLVYPHMQSSQCVTLGPAPLKKSLEMLIFPADLPNCGPRPPPSTFFYVVVGLAFAAFVLITLTIWLLVRRDRTRRKLMGDDFVPLHREIALGLATLARALYRAVCWFIADVVLGTLRFLWRTTVAVAVAIRAFCSITFVLPWRNTHLTVDNEAVQTALVGLAAVAFATEAALWWVEDPFAYFSSTMLGDLGLTSDDVNATNLDKQFWSWSLGGRVLSCVVSAVLLFVTCLRPCSVRPSPRRWQSLRLLVLAFAIVVQLSVLLLPSFFIPFDTSLSLVPHNGSITQNPAIGGGLQDTIGYGFTGIAFSYLANLLLFVLTGIQPGLYMATLSFLWGEPVRIWANKHSRTVFFARLRIVNVLTLFIVPVACSLQVVIIYQSMGVAVAWAVAFGGIWTCSVVCIGLVGLPMLFPRQHRLARWLTGQKEVPAVALSVAADDDTVDNNTNDDDDDKKPAASEALTSRWGVGVHMTFFLVYYLGLIVYVLWAEHSMRQLDAIFPLILVVTTAVVVYALSLTAIQNSFVAIQEQTRMIVSDKEDATTDTAVIWAALLELEGKMEREETEAKERMVQSLQAAVHVGGCWNVCWGAVRAAPSRFVHALHIDQFWWWLTERREREMPHRYGSRLPYRRVFLLVGIILNGYLVFSEMALYASESVKEQVVAFLASLNVGIVWPDADNGGTIFDDAFHLYGVARWIEWAFLFGGFTLLCASAVCDIRIRNKRGLRLSRALGFTALISMYCGVVSTALPNYLRATHVNLICPQCAPEFNNAVDLVSGDIVGIFCASLFTLSLLPILIAVAPALVRAAKLILTDGYMRLQLLGSSSSSSSSEGQEKQEGDKRRRRTSSDQGPMVNISGEMISEAKLRRSALFVTSPSLNINSSNEVVTLDCGTEGGRGEEEEEGDEGEVGVSECTPLLHKKENDEEKGHRLLFELRAHNVLLVFQFSSLLTPIITALPVIVYYQLLGDAVCATLILIFWFAPILVCVSAPLRRIGLHYNIFLVVYFVPLIAMVAYEVVRHDLRDAFLHNILESADFYCEIGAEIAIANVILSDILYTYM